MHPPPLSFMCGLLLFFVWSRPVISRLSKGISYLMYWVENIMYIFFFFLFEICISPVAYLKIWYNLLLILRTTGSGTVALVKSGAYCLIWALLGPILMIYIIAMDI
jgi:hypothetical protein